VLDLDRGWWTERLSLEPLSVAHAAEMGPLLDDASLHEFTGGVLLSSAALAARYAKLAGRRSPGGDQLWGNWVMRLRGTGAAVGTVQATMPSAGPAAGPAEIAWVVARRVQGRGYAKEAVRSLADRLLAAGWPVTAYIHPGHLASQHVAHAAGLAPTETTRQRETCWIRSPPAPP
jgi:RimJ/RimL family protein N-acetyltransferase